MLKAYVKIYLIGYQNYNEWSKTLRNKWGGLAGRGSSSSKDMVGEN